jgi:ABC-type nitrate/sulfonate/bicarbonate transport system permease component
MSSHYTAIPSDDDSRATLRPEKKLGATVTTALFATIAAVVSFVLGFAIGQNWSTVSAISHPQTAAERPLPSQVFIPESMKYGKNAQRKRN